MAELLIEILSEEIPARMQLQAARDFQRLFNDKLHKFGFTPQGKDIRHLFPIQTFVGPRRLVLCFNELPTELASISQELKGPKEGAPAQALEGFLRKSGLTIDQLVVENGVYMARVEKPGSKTIELLPPMLAEVMNAFPWPKSMRSGASRFQWVRPIKRILFLFDGAVVPFEIDGIKASNLTQGHRFLSDNATLEVSDFASYCNALLDNSVILDHKDRQDIILKQAKAVCDEAGFELIEDQGLLEEVAGLNEYPTALLGDMDPAFLSLPPEVIKTSMRTHQKYFAVRGADGQMAPKFVLVSNMRAIDGGLEIKRGNAKVLSARLSDAVFFWKEDNRVGNFDQWLIKLQGVTFHAKLGTMAQRVGRIEYLAKYLASKMECDEQKAEEAARLSKADLASFMVGEFPELQGVMGGYYAKAAGWSDDIAEAIRDHYKPQGPSDGLPKTALSACVALADKIDTLVGFFAIDEKPTGSKDPFALRRAALGILRIIRHFGVRISLSDLVAAWYQSLTCFFDRNQGVYVAFSRGSAGFEWKNLDYNNFNTPLSAGVSVLVTIDNELDLVVPKGEEQFRPFPKEILSFGNYSGVTTEFTEFFNDRLKVMLKDDNKRFDVIEAVLAVKDNDIVRICAKVEALDAVLKKPEGDAALAAYKRCANILSAEAKKGTHITGDAVLSDGLEASEADLISALNSAKISIDAASIQELSVQKFVDMVNTLAALQKNVDSFLDSCLVNSDIAEQRLNRLRLLAGVASLLDEVFDLSKLV